MKILAVSHEASATGAPIFFHTFLKWMKENKHCEIDLLLVKGGVLRRQFEDLGRSIAFEDFPDTDLNHQIQEFIKNKQYDFVYLNTLETAHVLNMLLQSGRIGPHVKVVSHVHELEGTIQKYGPDRIQILNNTATLIITASEAVKENLIQRHRFNPAKIQVVHSCSRDMIPSQFEITDSEVISNFGEKKMILACGEISVGKGVDTFLRTAIELRKRYRANEKKENFYFAWLGPDSYKVRNYFERDLEILNLNDVVHFFGHRDAVYPFFQKCSIFYMASRQDSFPLVCLEAASLKKPTIYFPDAGGIKSFLGSEGGLPLRYQDFEDAADKIELLLSDGALSSKLGQHAFQKWNEGYKASSICGQINALLDSIK